MPAKPSKLAIIEKTITDKDGAIRAAEEYTDILDLMTRINKPKKLTKPKIIDSLDKLFAPVWQDRLYFRNAMNYMAMVIRKQPDHPIYPFIQEFYKIPKKRRIEADYSIDDLINVTNDRLQQEDPSKFVDYTEVRRLINYYMDLYGSEQARSIMFDYSPAMVEMSMRIACDPEHPDSFKERDANMKFLQLRLPDKNTVQINIDKSTHQINQQANIGLPSFKDSVSVGSSTIRQEIKELPESASEIIDLEDLENEIDEAKIAERIFINREIHSDVGYESGEQTEQGEYGDEEYEDDFDSE